MRLGCPIYVKTLVFALAIVYDFIPMTAPERFETGAFEL
jgi:hypothetical protein